MKKLQLKKTIVERLNIANQTIIQGGQSDGFTETIIYSYLGSCFHGCRPGSSKCPAQEKTNADMISCIDAPEPLRPSSMHFTC